MSPRIALLQHERETGPGRLADLLAEAGVRSELVHTRRGALPDSDGFDAAIALGGSLSASAPALLATRRWIRDAVGRGMPFLGICLGGQLLASALGGSVTPMPRPEVGVHDVFLSPAARHDPLFAGLSPRLEVFGWHEDGFGLPPGAVHLASSIAWPCQAFRFDAAYGLQFHPELRAVDLERWRTVRGYRTLLERAGGDWPRAAAGLERATPALEALTRRLLDRWLHLVVGRASVAA